MGRRFASELDPGEGRNKATGLVSSNFARSPEAPVKPLDEKKPALRAGFRISEKLITWWQQPKRRLQQPKQPKRRQQQPKQPGLQQQQRQQRPERQQRQQPERPEQQRQQPEQRPELR